MPFCSRSSSCCQRSAAVPSLRMIATPRREGKAGDGEIEEEESARHSIMRHARGGKGKDSQKSPRIGSAMSIQSSFFEVRNKYCRRLPWASDFTARNPPNPKP
jgi:hypothetical protein